jgi:hypothetical protein
MKTFLHAEEDMIRCSVVQQLLTIEHLHPQQ